MQAVKGYLSDGRFTPNDDIALPSQAEAVLVFAGAIPQSAEIPKQSTSYNDPESMEALREAIQLINDPNAKTYNNVRELFAECLGVENDDD